MSEKKSLLYFQSGGPTAVINTSLYGAIDEAKKFASVGNIFGGRYGAEGLIKDDLIDLRAEDEENLKLLRYTPGPALGTTRYKLKDTDFPSIKETVIRHNIGHILVNGGNDSMDTCLRLHNFFKNEKMDVTVIGIPKTIDNDLALTDHSIGFPSAARHVISQMQMIAIDAKCYRKGKIFLAEIMGREAGWLTSASAILPKEYRPDIFILPEYEFNRGVFLVQAKAIYDQKGYAVVAMSEGTAVPFDTVGERDSFGHVSLGGAAYTLAKEVKNKLGIGARCMELSTPQRADTSCISKVDAIEAEEVARVAVRASIKGETGKMVILRRVSNNPYTIEYLLTPTLMVANQTQLFPVEWMDREGRFSPKLKEYLLPLVKDGLEVPRTDIGTVMTAKSINRE